MPRKIVRRFKLRGMNITFRYPRLSDLEEQLDFINSLVWNRAKIVVQKFVRRNDEEKWLKSRLEQIRKKQAVSLSVIRNGKLVGSAGVTKGPHPSKSHVGVFGIAIEQHSRGYGIGYRLMKSVIAQARKVLKVTVITLDVYGSNLRAQSLYKKCGFEQVGVIKNGACHYGKYEDLIIIVKYF